MNTPNPQQLNLLQYTHLEKLYGYFPGMRKVQPSPRSTA